MKEERHEKRRKRVISVNVLWV